MSVINMIWNKVNCKVPFNPIKSQIITFGGPNPNACEIHVYGKLIQWVNEGKHIILKIVT